MKTLKTLALILIAAVLFSCEPAVQPEPKIDLTSYNLNLATAQKFFASFSTEDIESQKPLLCPELLTMLHFWEVNLQKWRV